MISTFLSPLQTGGGPGSGRAGSPVSFVGTEADFEYDYYEPAVPGSFLDWPGELTSEIDIDQIIGDSDLMKTPTHRSVLITSRIWHCLAWPVC